MTLRWRPIAETPSLVREMTAMLRCTDDADDMYLLPGPAVWSTGGQCWVCEQTWAPIQFQTEHQYHWIPEADLL